MSLTSTAQWVLKAHDLLWLHDLTRELLRAFPDGLMPRPVYELHDLHVLQVRAPVDLRAHPVGESLEKQYAYGLGTHVVAILVNQLEPFIEVMVEILHTAALTEIQKLCLPGQFNQLITSLILSKESSPQLEPVTFNRRPHPGPAQIQRWTNPAQKE